MNELLKYFPDLSVYVIQENRVKFYHRKDNFNKFYQVFGQDFSEKDLNNFIKDRLLTSYSIKEMMDTFPEPSTDDLTINIRRGDFYEKGNTSIYGYDQVGFIKFVFANYLQNKSWNKIQIISDNMAWCKENFGFLNELTSELQFPELGDNPIISSFLRVSKSKNLILSNSTFSFWAAYLSNHLYQSENTTYCPIFGSRRLKNTDLYQYNPKWMMIRDFNFDTNYNQ